MIDIRIRAEKKVSMKAYVFEMTLPLSPPDFDKMPQGESEELLHGLSLPGLLAAHWGEYEEYVSHKVCSGGSTEDGRGIKMRGIVIVGRTLLISENGQGKVSIVSY